MLSAMFRNLRDLAGEAADRLASSVPSLESICLFGSVSRGQETKWSDIDLLLLGSDTALTPTKLLAALPPNIRQRRVSLIYYPTSVFRRMSEEGDLFVEHIRRE